MSDVDPDSTDVSDADTAAAAPVETPEATTPTKTAAKKPPAKKSTAKKTPAKRSSAKAKVEQSPAPQSATIDEEPTATLATTPVVKDATATDVAPVADATEDADAISEPAAAPDESTSEASPSRIDQLKVFAAAVEARGRATYEHLEAQRAESRAIDSVFVAVEHDEKTGGGILSAAIAFRLFLFLVPLVFVVVVGFGLGADAAGQSTHDAAQSAGAAGLLARSMANIADGSISSRITAFVVGSFALWLTSRSALKVLRVASGLIWGVPIPKLPRPTRAAGFLILIVLAGVVLVQIISGIRHESLVIGILATILFVLVPAWLWLIVSYRGLPHAEGAGRRAMLPGSVLVGIGIQLLHLFTVFWIARQVDSKSETYGAIGVALALLFWAYLMGRVITAGMTLNAALWYRDHPRTDNDDAPIHDMQPQPGHTD